MYPQYAASTTATAVDSVAAYAARLRDQPELRFVKRYHDDPEYIDALARQVRDYWNINGKPERLLLSFHGLPRRTVEQGDPYYRDCMETASLLRQRLAADGELVHVSFQSRFGAEKWLEPYTEPTLREWARQGISRVDVMCPGFLADCLETLEEIQMQCRDAFLSEGGRQFRYLPCLNGDPDWTAGLAGIAARHLAGWIPDGGCKL
jgi:ferrochelatase